MAKKTKTARAKKTLIKNPEHQLLTIKEVMDTVLLEAENLPASVKDAITSARDASWREFVAEHEKTMPASAGATSSSSTHEASSS
ncbi:MAG: hypothetical protein K9L30_15875 [Desulfobacterales bacterium]|nr:hypothetical protein [Desulfobacterales bacterium]